MTGPEVSGRGVLFAISKPGRALFPCRITCLNMRSTMIKTKFTDLLLDAQLDRNVMDKTASLLAGLWPSFGDNQQFTVVVAQVSQNTSKQIMSPYPCTKQNTGVLPTFFCVFLCLLKNILLSNQDRNEAVWQLPITSALTSVCGDRNRDSITVSHKLQRITRI